jgi:phosphatidylglycerophosphatase A
VSDGRGYGFERFCLTAGGLGRLRPAPGTWGSLPPAALAFLMARIGCPIEQIALAMVLLMVAASVATVRFGELGERIFGKKDPGSVVSDEVAGQALTLVWLPWGIGLPEDLTLAAAGFLLFRILDIVKPPPAQGIQSRRGGWGILLDDLVAGAYGAVALSAFAWWWWPGVA